LHMCACSVEPRAPLGVFAVTASAAEKGISR
jgi:hypothetical protein